MYTFLISILPPVPHLLMEKRLKFGVPKQLVVYGILYLFVELARKKYVESKASMEVLRVEHH